MAANDGDLLWGANAIADFLFGSHSPAIRRRVYNLAAAGNLPIIHVGQTLTARKSKLKAFFDAAEDLVMTPKSERSPERDWLDAASDNFVGLSREK